MLPLAGDSHLTGGQAGDVSGVGRVRSREEWWDRWAPEAAATRLRLMAPTSELLGLVLAMGDFTNSLVFNVAI